MQVILTYDKLIFTMTAIIEVEKSSSESNASLMRRFSRRARNLGHVKKLKTNRYASRPKSDLKKKQDKLKRIKKSQVMERLKKYGRIKDTRY